MDIIKHKLYRKWYSMKDRCYNESNPKFKHYGLRGIYVCDLWLNSFDNFYSWSLSNGYKQGLYIDRIDNNDIYKPSNCRFTTNQIQSINRRKLKNNTSGVTGVLYRKETKINPAKWCARIKVNGKQIEKSFSISKYGYKEAKNKAIKERTLLYNKYFKTLL